jgi:nucleotide-binding universal stress UspA family protein
MFDTVVIATDGSKSAERSVEMAVDLAAKFDGDVHALYVVDTDEIEGSPDEIRDDLEQAIHEAGDEALSYAEQEVDGLERTDISTAIRQGEPANEIIDYAAEVDADAIALGTRGRHGEHAFLLGSVAESVVRQAPQPVLTVRQLEASA